MNGRHLQAVTTCSEIFYGDFIKICFYKNPSLCSEAFWWGLGCLCVPGIALLYLALLVSMQSCWNITFALLCHLVKRDTYERLCRGAIKSTFPVLPRCYISLSCTVAGALQSYLFIFLHLALIWDLRVRTQSFCQHSACLWSHLIQDRAEMRRPEVVRPYFDPRLISSLAAAAQASAVYNLRLSGCSSAAAVGLRLSSCCFSALPHVWAGPLQFNLSPRQKIAPQIWKKKWEAERATYSHEGSVL